jgi:hypothetical protein
LLGNGIAASPHEIHLRPSIRRSGNHRAKTGEIANSAVQDGRIYIEKINGPMLFKEGASPAEYKVGLDLAIARGWLVLHRSGTFVRFTQAGAELFA